MISSLKKEFIEIVIQSALSGKNVDILHCQSNTESLQAIERWVQYFGKDSILDAVGTIRTLIEKRKILKYWLFIVVLGVCSQNQIKIDLFPYDTYCCLEEKNVTSRIFGIFLQQCRKHLLIHWMLDRSLGTIKENYCHINQVLSVIIIAQYQEQLLYWVF